MLYHDLLDCDRKLTVCGTSVLPAEGIIPTGIMARSQVTLLRKPVIERKMSVAYSQIIVHHFNHSNHNSDNRATDFYQHVAPLGLKSMVNPCFYTHAAPLGLRTFTRECYLLKELFRQG